MTEKSRNHKERESTAGKASGESGDNFLEKSLKQVENVVEELYKDSGLRRKGHVRKGKIPEAERKPRKDLYNLMTDIKGQIRKKSGTTGSAGEAT
jgi:dynactin complex subunit